MYYFVSRLEVSAEETPHVLGSEDGFQYIQHEVPNKLIKMSNKTYYYINTNEIPGELSHENLVSSHVEISPLLWLHNKSHLSHQKTIKVKWFGSSLVFIIIINKRSD